MIIVSHDMGTIRETCNRGMLIHEGRATIHEDVAEAIAAYDSL